VNVVANIESSAGGLLLNPTFPLATIKRRHAGDAYRSVGRRRSIILYASCRSGAARYTRKFVPEFPAGPCTRLIDCTTVACVTRTRDPQRYQRRPSKWTQPSHKQLKLLCFAQQVHHSTSVSVNSAIPGAGHLFRYVTNQPPKANSAFIPLGAVNEYTSFGWEGKGSWGMVHFVSGWTRGVQVKLWDPLRMRAIPERLRGVIIDKALYKSTFTFTLPYLTLLTDEAVKSVNLNLHVHVLYSNIISE